MPIAHRILDAEPVTSLDAYLRVGGGKGLKAARMRAAIEEMRASDLAAGVQLDLMEGPTEYLLGEETALLEAIDGRYPFPRIAPPYRRGAEEIVEHADDVTSGSGLSAHVEM